MKRTDNTTWVDLIIPLFYKTFHQSAYIRGEESLLTSPICSRFFPNVSLLTGQFYIANTMCGGDNCGRGAVLGALFGAVNGLQGWPARWLDGLLNPPPIPKIIEDR